MREPCARLDAGQRDGGDTKLHVGVPDVPTGVLAIAMARKAEAMAEQT